jgi:uncharacterized protein YjdB
MKLRHSFISLLLTFVMCVNMTNFHISAEENPESGGEQVSEVFEEQNPEGAEPEETINETPDNLPEETELPEGPDETVREETPLPEETIAPTEDPFNTEGELPEETAAPEATEVPEETEHPEATEVPEETAAPEEEEEEFEEMDISDLLLQEGALFTEEEGSSAEGIFDPKSFPEWAEVNKTIADGAESRLTEINLEKYKLTTAQLRSMYVGLLNRNPQLFFVEGSFFYSSYVGEDGVRYIKDVKPRYSSAYSAADYDRFKAAADEILAGIDPGWTTVQKAMYLHDQLVILNDYDLTYKKYNAYNALVEHSSVCQGYSLAYLYLCNRVGIECDIVTSDAMGHAWNIVSIDNKGYYVDNTWDDPIGSSTTHLYTQNVGHSNFLNSQAKHATTGHDSTDWLNGYQENINGLYNVKTYDDAWFKDCTSPIPSIGSVSGFIKNRDNRLQVYDYATGSTRVLATLPDSSWPVFGSSSTWKDTYWGLATDGTNFYASGPKTIYCVTPDGNLTKLYSLSASELKVGYIYGIRVEGNTLVYDLQRDRDSSTYQTSGTVQLGGGGGGGGGDVPPAVTAITFAVKSSSILMGGTETQKVTITPEGAATVSSLVFQSSNPAVATVDASGKVTAVYPGTAVITASTQDGSVSGSYTVTVTPIVLKSLAIYADQDVLWPGEQVKLTVKCTPENATYQEVTWSSANPDIASVDANGNVTALKAGQATIHVTSKTYASITSKKIIEVVKPVESVTLEKYDKEIQPGYVIDLKATILPSDAHDQTLKWESSNENIASVSSTGKVTAKKTGTVTISVQSVRDSSKKDSIQLTISAKGVTDVLVSQQNATLLVGDPLQLHAQTLPADADDSTVTWRSSNPAVATVDRNGIVLAVGEGKADIIAEASNGKNARCTVNVKVNKITAEIQYPEGKQFFYYTGDALKPSVAVKDGDVLLTEKTDYTLSYKNNKMVGTGTVTVKMKGRYTGTTDLSFRIEKVSLGEENKAVLVDIPVLKYNKGKALSPKVTVYWNGKKLALNKDYTLSAPNPNPVTDKGTYTMTVTGTGTNFTGSRSVTFRVEATAVKSTVIALSKAKESYLKNIVYDGTLKYLVTDANDKNRNFVLKYNDQTLIENEDYIILKSTYAANMNAGTASVTLQGIGDYNGVKKLKFKILPDTMTIKKSSLTIDPAALDKNGKVPYAKGGAVPKILIEGLAEGSDYKVAYKNNKAVGTGTAAVTFLGNYKGTGPYEKTFPIAARDLSEVTAYAKDIVKGTKKGNFAIKPTVTDLDGKALSSGKDYEKTFEYWECDSDGQPIRLLDPKTDILNYETYVRITIRSVSGSSYQGVKYVVFHVMDAANDLSKATITIPAQEYTGLPIYLSDQDIKVTLKGVAAPLKLGTDYKILSYTNNVKTGTAKVTIQGIGRYGGVKNQSFKITGRSINNHN